MNMKNICALTILPVWLALISVEVSAQRCGVEGAQTTTDDPIQTDAAWDTLLAVTVTIPNTGSPWHCVATGSADALNPSGDTTQNLYRFTLSNDDINPPIDSACERTLEMNDNPGVNDSDVTEVSSTCKFINVDAGNHTIRWTARKVAADDADMTVRDSSLSVVCCDDHL
jgi:hypothetical protein